jgi:hypothetical protein
MAKAVAKTSLRDKKLLELASQGASGAEMEEALGIPAPQAILRVKELLSQDAFDEIEQRKLSIMRLQKVVAQIDEAGVDVENPKHIEAYSKLTLAIDRILNNMTQMNEQQLAIVTDAQARKMIQMIEAAYGRARDLLKQEYGDLIDITAINNAFSEGLRSAYQEI